MKKSNHAGYVIESRSQPGSRRELFTFPDRAGCVAKLMQLANSGARLISIRWGGQPVDPLLLRAGVVLVSRQMILDRLRVCFNLSRLQAEQAFGHLLVEHALRVQEFLRGAAFAIRPASLKKTTHPGSGAHLGPGKNVASVNRPEQGWPATAKWNFGSQAEGSGNQPGAGAARP